MLVESLCNVFYVLYDRNGTKGNALMLLCGDFNADLLTNDAYKKVFINLLKMYCM